MSETEQDKTEEPTPHKLRKAREKGQIAKGQDLPFFGSLIGLALFMALFGATFMNGITQSMALSFTVSVEGAGQDNAVQLAVARIYRPAIMLILTFAACTVTFVFLMQLLQNKGLLFTTHPLKPDFTKLNPAKGLKRIFSMRTLKEAGKNILKMMIYLGATYLVIRYCIRLYGTNLNDGNDVARALFGSGMRLLYLYIILSFFFAMIDQVIVRKEFHKQMKMSRSELKREVKDREGEPRMKAKRKELHKEFAKQTGSLGDLPGSDMLIVNPQHFAVALRYDAETMTEPVISAKGRNRFALLLKTKAVRLDIPILTNPPLARALYRGTNPGQSVPPQHFKAIADSYVAVMRIKSAKASDTHTQEQD